LSQLCAVTKRIKQAIQTIGGIVPALGRNLTARIKTGYFCSYNPHPDRPVAWRKNNKTGYREVYVDGRTGKFRATISRDGKQVYLGFFDSLDEAAHVYDGAAVNYYGPLARLNFPRARPA
jgi:hypothetical protein